MKIQCIYRKVLILFAISLSVSQLSACNYSTNNKSVSQPSNTFIKTDTVDPMGKYNPPIDISFVRAVDGILQYDVLSKTPGETIEDNRWLKLYKDNLGININYKWTIGGNYFEEPYVQKMNVAIASDDLPDVIPVTPTQLKQLDSAGLIEDMTQYYKKYASNLTKRTYNEHDGITALDAATINGKLMAIPNIDSSIECAQFIWIRKDWLKKLGLQPPETMNELLKISEAFTTKDPDGNGKNDTYGLAIFKDLYNGCIGLEGFFAGYRSYPNFWMEDSSGRLVYGSIQPETKKALEALAKMYKSGQLDKEFGIKDAGKVSNDIAEGRVGIEFGEQWNPSFPLYRSYNKNNNADWQAYSLVSIDNKPIKVPIKSRTYLYFAVKKGYSHPEAVVKMINLHLEKNWGETNEFNKYYMPPENDNVCVWKFSPVSPYPPYKNLDAFLEIDKARKIHDFSKLKGEPKAIEDNIEAFQKGDKSQWNWNEMYGADGVFNILKQYKTSNSLMYEKYYGYNTKTMVEKMGDLIKLEKEEFIKIIMGDAPIDEFDKYVNYWNKLGGSQITNEVNEWYKSHK